MKASILPVLPYISSGWSCWRQVAGAALKKDHDENSEAIRVSSLKKK